MFENSFKKKNSDCGMTTDQAVSRKTSLTLEELENTHIHWAALKLKP